MGQPCLRPLLSLTRIEKAGSSLLSVPINNSERRFHVFQSSFIKVPPYTVKGFAYIKFLAHFRRAFVQVKSFLLAMILSMKTFILSAMILAMILYNSLVKRNWPEISRSCWRIRLREGAFL